MDELWLSLCVITQWTCVLYIKKSLSVEGILERSIDSWVHDGPFW